MRRSHKVHIAKRLHLYLMLLCSIVGCVCLAGTAYADDITFDHYSNVSIGYNPPESSTSEASPDTDEVNLTKEELDMQQFNGEILDTIIYIIGGISGFMMILQITVFAWTKLYPSANGWIEKLQKIGIDGYSDGYIFPTVKILLLGVFSYLCISGYFKQIIVTIVSWFTIVFK